MTLMSHYSILLILALSLLCCTVTIPLPIFTHAQQSTWQSEQIYQSPKESQSIRANHPFGVPSTTPQYEPNQPPSESSTVDQTDSSPSQSTYMRDNVIAAAEKAELISSEIQLLCPVASACGLNNTVNAPTMLFTHPDLSIAAAHALFFPFMQPMLQSLNDSGDAVTVLLPASAAVLRQETYELNAFCGNSSNFQSTNACKATKAIVDVDTAVFENAQKLAINGQLQVRYIP
jgi:hypothetical protein